MTGRVRSVLILPSLLLMAGAALAQQSQPTPNTNTPAQTGPSVNDPRNPAPNSGAGTNPGGMTGPSSSGAAVDPKTYKIGAEDIILVRVWREPEISGFYTVRPDGKFTMPLIREVEASGMTPDELSKSLTEKLGQFYNKPDVTVSVQQVLSKKYSIIGEVNRTGPFPLVTPTRVLDALANAGGFHEFANTKKIRIVRGTTRLNFNYNEVIKGKHPEQNVLLENGDLIIVP